MNYRCIATSKKGFIQQIACVYLRHGYRWFVRGTVKPEKDPAAVDAKLVAKYGIDVSEATRWRRKQLGKANMHYLRFEREFLLLASKGVHDFYQMEKDSIRYTVESPIRAFNYTISYRPGGRTRAGEKDPRWHSHVQIEWEHYKELKAMFTGLACRRSPAQLARLFYELPFEPYAPVRRQITAIWAEVNRQRKRARLEPVPVDVLPLRTRSVKVFEPDSVHRLRSSAGWWYEVRNVRRA